MSRECADPLAPMNVRVFDGAGYPSFSKLVNDCIMSTEEEVVIICNDKARPAHNDVIRMMGLINDGHGLVGLYRFGFFGFKKDLIRRIGFFDERFISGEYEDHDMLRRLKEANISYWGEESIHYKTGPSRWNNAKSFLHYLAKWRHTGEETMRRLLPEEDYGYDIGADQGAAFKPWADGKMDPKMAWFMDVEVVV
tara:strand:- start:34377 stop:34961 length:585 start_codon:yes stop_codon:yes gene_type:complete